MAKKGDTTNSNQIAIKTNELFIWFGGCVYMFYGPNIGTDINLSFSDLYENENVAYWNAFARNEKIIILCTYIWAILNDEGMAGWLFCCVLCIRPNEEKM